MGSDATMVHASAPAISKDAGKKKKNIRAARLKQCKLDARREQWLSQVKNKGLKISDYNATPPQLPCPTPPPSSLPPLSDGPGSVWEENIKIRAKQENNIRLEDAHDSDTESFFNSPTSSSSGMNYLMKNCLCESHSSHSSTSGSGSYTQSVNEEKDDDEEKEDDDDDEKDDDDDDDDGFDDWETIASCANHDHSPLMGLPDQFSHLEWGHWFTLRELQLATHFFSDNHIIGDGGYGIVYKGDLINGTQVAIKKLHNHLGQAEKEFRVEVDAIGHVRHKNLVRLLGFCIEGTQRMLIYEYVKNGNLDQWLHGEARSLGFLDWEKRMKILLGTAKALAYLHEAIEPKVVHRDIKSSNILIDDDFNAKVSDFGLAKLLGPENPHITTRVMGTFGYVAPEYAKTGFLNEKSDIYSFGIVLLETITGRNPVDYGRAAHEINLVEWLKTMISSKRSEEVIDPRFEIRPSTKALKRALLIALRCLDPDYSKRPKMSQVVQMMESDDDHQMTSRNDRSRAMSKNRNNINAPISEYVVGRSN